MRLLLLFTLIETTLFSHAQQTNVPAKDETISSIITSCLPMVLLISIVIGGAVYFLVTNNKRSGINENSNSEKTK